MDRGSSKPLRVPIVDDHDIAVIGGAASTTEAIEEIVRFGPDVVLMDVR